MNRTRSAFGGSDFGDERNTSEAFSVSIASDVFRYFADAPFRYFVGGWWTGRFGE
jgi:hypothetical protein